jgi:hypothetical protein
MEVGYEEVWLPVLNENRRKLTFVISLSAPSPGQSPCDAIPLYLDANITVASFAIGAEENGFTCEGVQTVVVEELESFVAPVLEGALEPWCTDFFSCQTIKLNIFVYFRNGRVLSQF